MKLGIDEVGRGAWAGPLVVGACVLGDTQIDGLTDSKLLGKKRREALDIEIRAKASGVGLGWVWPNEIDEIGLGPSLRLATRRAVKDIQSQHIPFHEIIIDGTINFLSDTSLAKYVTTLKKADLLIQSVSAASIVAKVARDNYMIGQAEQYLEYGFDTHVGYGTAVHRAAIDKHGVTPLHRLSIAPLSKYRTGQKSEEKSSNIKTTRQIGDESESVAARELKRRGHKIIERNWKTKWCEIDIVSRLGDTYYFTEVKHRRKADNGDGLAAITPKKFDQMKKAAELYALQQKLKNVDLQLMAIATSGDIPKVDSLISIE